jgi:hypothetical protein
MTEKKEITGYYTDDGNIYCVDCILKTQEEIREEIEKAITVEDIEEELYFCYGCNKEISVKTTGSFYIGSDVEYQRKRAEKLVLQ